MSTIIMVFVLYLFASALGEAMQRCIPFVFRLAHNHPKIAEAIYLVLGFFGAISIIQ